MSPCLVSWRTVASVSSPSGLMSVRRAHESFASARRGRTGQASSSVVQSDVFLTIRRTCRTSRTRNQIILPETDNCRRPDTIDTDGDLPGRIDLIPTTSCPCVARTDGQASSSVVQSDVFLTIKRAYKTSRTRNQAILPEIDNCRRPDTIDIDGDLPGRIGLTPPTSCPCVARTDRQADTLRPRRPLRATPNADQTTTAH